MLLGGVDGLLLVGKSADGGESDHTEGDSSGGFAVASGLLLLGALLSKAEGHLSLCLDDGLEFVADGVDVIHDGLREGLELAFEVLEGLFNLPRVVVENGLEVTFKLLGGGIELFHKPLDRIHSGNVNGDVGVVFVVLTCGGFDG